MSADPFVEVRGDVLIDHVEIMDAVAQATPGGSRMSVLREIIAEWVVREKHRAMLVNRVSRSNGNGPESHRSPTGITPESRRRRAAAPRAPSGNKDIER